MSEVQQTEQLNPHSVEIGRSATGKVTIAVKSYGATVSDAYAQAKAIYDQANAENPAA
ncbi:MAG: hypothetical protein WCJ84_00540 [Candidatus Peregrinibacteria bacterium]